MKFDSVSPQSKFLEKNRSSFRAGFWPVRHALSSMDMGRNEFSSQKNGITKKHTPNVVLFALLSSSWMSWCFWSSKRQQNHPIWSWSSDLFLVELNSCACHLVWKKKGMPMPWISNGYPWIRRLSQSNVWRASNIKLAEISNGYPWPQPWRVSKIQCLAGIAIQVAPVHPEDRIPYCPSLPWRVSKIQDCPRSTVGAEDCDSELDDLKDNYSSLQSVSEAMREMVPPKARLMRRLSLSKNGNQGRQCHGYPLGIHGYADCPSPPSKRV